MLQFNSDPCCRVQTAFSSLQAKLLWGHFSSGCQPLVWHLLHAKNPPHIFKHIILCATFLIQLFKHNCTDSKVIKQNNTAGLNGMPWSFYTSKPSLSAAQTVSCIYTFLPGCLFMSLMNHCTNSVAFLTTIKKPLITAFQTGSLKMTNLITFVF